MKEGDRFSCTFVVSREVYEGFMEVFGDRNPLHTDAGYARSKGFGSEVMHGNILNGFISHFVGERLPTKDVVIHSQEIKYYLPVYLNDRLELHAEVRNVSDAVKVVEMEFRFCNEAGSKVARGKVQIGILA
jgi:3-hydroxybutyryl-CoA dehydratase